MDYQSKYTGAEIDEGLRKALEEIGNLSNLDTAEHGSIVGALNEVVAGVSQLSSEKALLYIAAEDATYAGILKVINGKPIYEYEEVAE